MTLRQSSKSTKERKIFCKKSVKNKMSICFLFTFLVACAGIIFYTYTTDSTAEVDKISGEPLSHAFSDKAPIIYGIVCTISVTSAIALELFLDFIIESEYSTDDLGERLAMILVIIVPGVFILRSSDERGFAFIFSSWHTIQTIGCSAPIYSLCCKLVPTHFNRPLLLFSYVLWATSGVTSVCGFGHPFLYWANLLTLGFASLSLIFLAIIVWAWFSELRRNKTQGSFCASGIAAFVHLFNVEEICCFLYLCCNLSTIVIVPSIVGVLKSYSWENLDRAAVCVFIYSLAVFSVLPSCIPGRIVRHAARLHEHKTKTNFALIRYVSHEIRTPLNVIQNGLELLSEDVQKNCNEETVCILGDMKCASADATNIIDDLLGVHKINTGTFSMDRRFEHINCLPKIAESCQYLVQRKDLRFYFENHLEPAKLCIDTEKVGQAFRSIVSYATKFTPPGGFVRIALQYQPNVQQNTQLQNWQTEILSSDARGCPLFKYVREKLRYFVSSSSDSLENIDSRSQKIHSFKASRPHSFLRGQENNKPIGTAVLKVSSSGVGLCSIQAKKILCECSEFDERSLHSGGGSGLSLLIFRETVQKNGGKIIMDISKGESTISVSFKCYKMNHRKNKRETLVDLQSLTQNLNPHKNSGEHESMPTVRTLKNAQIPLKQEETISRFGNKSSRKKTCQVHADIVEHEIIPKIKNELPQETSFASTPPTGFNLTSTIPSQMQLSDSVGHSIIESNDLSSEQLTCEILLRVLVVDDVKMNRKLIQRMLNQFKVEAVMPSSYALELEIIEADDGTSAVECIEKSICTFDIVFMDNIMTKMNGPQAAAIMRKKDFSGMIIGVTGNVLDEDIADFISHGASLILPKPLSKLKLGDILWKTIDGKLSSNDSV